MSTPATPPPPYSASSSTSTPIVDVTGLPLDTSTRLTPAPTVAPSMSPSVLQPQVIFVRRNRANAFGQLPYHRRARLTFWGNPCIRLFTVIFLLMVIVGIILDAASPMTCADGCDQLACVDPYGRTFQCTCAQSGNTTCEEEVMTTQGQAGAAVLAVGVAGLLFQAILACACCLCWLPAFDFDDPAFDVYYL